MRKKENGLESKVELKGDKKWAAIQAIAVGSTLLAMIGFSVGQHFDRDVYRATVTEKERVVKRSSSKYLIFTELENGEIKVFENADSILELKWNSSDVYAQIKEGETYEFKTYGWRIPFLSQYENIIGIEKITPDPPN